MMHVARQPLAAPLMKFQNIEGVADLGCGGVIAALFSAGYSGLSENATNWP